MDYIYDVVLNFQNNYYEFYEWKQTDKIINVKKILVYLVNNQDYLNLKYNDVVISKKTLPKQIKMFLVTNGIEVMGVLLNQEGKIVKRSSLLLEEADDVLEEKETIKHLPLKYIKNIEKSHTTNNRLLEEKINFIQKYFSNIDIIKDEYLLKYIYYEIYNREEENINKVYKQLKELIKNDINTIYKSIKKVSIELKK